MNLERSHPKSLYSMKYNGHQILKKRLIIYNTVMEGCFSAEGMEAGYLKRGRFLSRL